MNMAESIARCSVSASSARDTGMAACLAQSYQ